MTGPSTKATVRNDHTFVADFLAKSSSYRTLYQHFGLPDSSTSELADPISTHCAKIYLTPQIAIKIKLPVDYGYLQMVSLKDRKKYLLREFELNKPFLPDIYLGVVAIVQNQPDKLVFNPQPGADDNVLEWALVMSRFEEDQVLDNLAKKQQLSKELAKQLGEAIAKYHSSLEPTNVSDGSARIEEVVSELNEEFAKLSQLLPQAEIDKFKHNGHQTMQTQRSLLNDRGQSGFVKRCHGDLHLRNILMHKGVPVPFDALEFNERFATTDILYDLAFLLMDLNHRGLDIQANAVMNEYFLHFDSDNICGLNALPLFMFCRAGIRAMTSAQAALIDRDSHRQKTEESRAYLQMALQYLDPRTPFVIAVGGFSGSGKSTIAAKLPNLLCPAPGALLLRSDTERKVLFGVSETTHLGEDHYAIADNSRRVYERLLNKVRNAALAKYPVIVDAAFIDKDQQVEIELVARHAGVAFQGFWLEANPDIMRERINTRVGDASDATATVLEKQYRNFTGHNQWSHIDTSGSVENNLEQLIESLCIPELPKLK